MKSGDRTRMREMEDSKSASSNQTGANGRTLAEAEAEIERLQRELDQAHEELDSLTEVTSGFVRLMI